MGVRRPDPHYTVDDYLEWEGRWELWYGRAIAMSPSPATRHGEFMVEVAALLRNALRGRDNCPCQIFGEIEWRVMADTVVRPDLSVVCGDRMEGTHIDRPPTLIIEILSPATRGTDPGSKRALYASKGVSLYLVVDPDDGRVRCFRLRGDGYEEEEPDADEFDLTMHDGCGIRFPVQLHP